MKSFPPGTRKHPRPNHVAAACVLLATCAASAQPLPGNTAIDSTATAGGVPATDVQVGERLSSWLLRQPDDTANAGLAWRVPQERLGQQFLKNTLLVRLEAAGRRAPRAEQVERQGLITFLQNLPVTGRVALGILDPRWLQAHPEQDPVLATGQQLVAAPPLSGTVSVLRTDGTICQVAHEAGRTAWDYTAACGLGSGRDWAWVAQPDGRIARTSVAAWNAQPSDEPAPGAWIWAPPRSMPDLVKVSEGLIRFLATQGPAPHSDTVLAPSPALPLIPEAAPQYRAGEISGNDWGEIGLMQTPSARMGKAGGFRSTISHVEPYTRLTVMFQPLDWLEAGFRYTSISNRSFAISDQSLKDKSIDVKARLLRESAYVPELALGFRDIGGTGLFSSEYLVASKRYGDLDFSLGLGWGNMGSSGNVRNPLTLLSHRFDTRPPATAAGNVNLNTYFRGPSALFGGVQWHTPWDPLTLKLEYDGNDYQHEPESNNLSQRSPFNVGLVYRYSSGVSFSAGLERGNKLMVGITLSTDLASLQAPKTADPPAPRFSPTPPAESPGWAATAADLQTRTGWTIQRIAPQGSSLHVWITNVGNTVYREGRVEQIAAVLHRDAPASIQNFVLHYSERGMPMHAQVIDRGQWVTAHYQVLPPGAARESSRHDYAPTPEDNDRIRLRTGTASNATAAASTAAASSAKTPEALAPWERGSDRFTFGITPSFTQILGGPDAFLLYQIGVQASAEYRFTNSTWVNAALNLRVIDNYDKFKFTAPSNLPRVRTFQREYVTSSRLTLPQLQLTHVGRLSANQYYSVYGGMLESMFGGVGAEWLYRPWRSSVAFGIDANHVRQRGFDQDFSFRDYQVNTGHATLYWNTGWNGVMARVSVGQYLAGDRGATIDISRRFDNGVTVGAYATKTNVSSAQFGEGGFDKGIYVSIPFDALLPRSSPFNASFVWAPLVRDGGARLARANTLYEMTSSRDRRAFSFGPPQSETPSAGDNILNFDR